MADPKDNPSTTKAPAPAAAASNETKSLEVDVDEKTAQKCAANPSSTSEKTLCVAKMDAKDSKKSASAAARAPAKDEKSPANPLSKEKMLSLKGDGGESKLESGEVPTPSPPDVAPLPPCAPALDASNGSHEDLVQWANELAPLPSTQEETETGPAPSRPGAFAVRGMGGIRSRMAAAALTLMPPGAPAAASSSAVSTTTNDNRSISLTATLAPSSSRSRATRSQIRTSLTDSSTQRSRDLENGHGGSRPTSMLIEGKVVEDEPTEAERKMRTIFISSALLILISAVVLLSLGLAGVFSSNSDDGRLQTTESLSHLEVVRARGVLKCKFFFTPGFMERDEATGEVFGLSTQPCEAVAAAIFGPENAKVEYVIREGGASTYFDKSFYDMGPVGDTPVLDRRRSFTKPTFYDGARVVGDPFYVECAENDFKHTDECEGLSVCLQEQSTTYRYLLLKLNQRKVVFVRSPLETMRNLITGACNVVFARQISVNKTQIRSFGYTGGLDIGETMHTKAFTSLTTSSDDVRFSDFVNAVMQSLIVAEQNNITQATAHLFPQTTVFGEEYKDMFRNAIKAVGNYNEVYQKFAEPYQPRTSINRINNGTSGLLNAFRLEQRAYEDDKDPTLGPILRQVLDQGKVRCGVRFDRPGFAMDGNMTGFDLDFCRAVAASLFGGDTDDSVEFVELADSTDGYKKLASREVDIVAGATWNLVNDVQEPTTGLGFAFSPPYFYGCSPEEDNLCLATLEDDQDWTMYIFWVVNAIIFAEEENFDKNLFNSMPEVDVFGPDRKRMFKDAVLGVGNYGEIYDQNLAAIFPRSGRNLLHTLSDQSPQHYPMPGLM